MKVIVIIDIPEIKNPDSTEATFHVEVITDDLKRSIGKDYTWWIDDVIGEPK